MKIRSGFVSNSSSSSFIVGFNRKPTSVGEMQRILFGEAAGDVLYFDYSMPIEDVAQRVLNDINKQTPVSEEKILEEISHGCFEGMPKHWSDPHYEKAVEDEFLVKYNEWATKNGKPTTHYFHSEEAHEHPEYQEYAERVCKLRDERYERENAETLEAAKRLWDRNKRRFEGKLIYVVSYADDGGEAVLEHGDIFDNIPHIRISHH